MAAPTQELSPKVTIASDKCSAQLSVPPGCDPLLLTEESLLGQIRDSGVEVTEFTKQAVTDTIKNLPAQDGAVTVLIARAQPVVHGVNGRIEWLVSTAGAEVSSDGDTSVSHYDQCAFVMVKAGDEVGRVHPPTFGEDGRDVAGETIPAKSGKEAVLQINESLMKKADGTLVAQDDGLLHRETGKAQIRKKIEIKDYVDFSTGNIDFDGDITIERGVRDCFVVKATGSIEVNGLIEAATMEAGADLIALGGFAGRERGFATIGGCLRGKYLDNVQGTVQQDLCIDREVINCELRIDGAIDSPHGSIIGGTVTTTGAINIGTLGSGAGAATEIVIGSVPRLEPFANELTEILEILSADADKLTGEQDMINKLSVKGRMTATDKERQTEIMFELSNVNTALGKVQRTLDCLNREIDSRRTVDVTVNKKMNCGSLFVLGEKRYKITSELGGPVAIFLDDRKELACRQGDAAPRPLSQIADVQAIIPPKRAA
jgi:uncharacterized protein